MKQPKAAEPTDVGARTKNNGLELLNTKRKNSYPNTKLAKYALRECRVPAYWACLAFHAALWPCRAALGARSTQGCRVLRILLN